MSVAAGRIGSARLCAPLATPPEAPGALRLRINSRKMTEPPTESSRERHAPGEPRMPGWVPIVIGIVLVIMAGLAVWTGLRYRNPTLAGGIIHPQHTPRGMTGGGPDEQEPGASLVFPENSPTANETTTAAGVMVARRALETNVVPDDAMVYVNGVPIGEAKQFDAAHDGYDFPTAGSYTVRLVAPGYKDAQFVVSASEDAAQEIARIDLRMQRQQ